MLVNPLIWNQEWATHVAIFFSINFSKIIVCDINLNIVFDVLINEFLHIICVSNWEILFVEILKT